MLATGVKSPPVSQTSVISKAATYSIMHTLQLDGAYALKGLIIGMSYFGEMKKKCLFGFRNLFPRSATIKSGCYVLPSLTAATAYTYRGVVPLPRSSRLFLHKG